MCWCGHCRWVGSTKFEKVTIASCITVEALQDVENLNSSICWSRRFNWKLVPATQLFPLDLLHYIKSKLMIISNWKLSRLNKKLNTKNRYRIKMQLHLIAEMRIVQRRTKPDPKKRVHWIKGTLSVIYVAKYFDLFSRFFSPFRITSRRRPFSRLFAVLVSRFHAMKASVCGVDLSLNGQLMIHIIFFPRLGEIFEI